jgi:hypothetical protein
MLKNPKQCRPKAIYFLAVLGNQPAEEFRFVVINVNAHAQPRR